MTKYASVIKVFDIRFNSIFEQKVSTLITFQRLRFSEFLADIVRYINEIYLLTHSAEKNVHTSISTLSACVSIRSSAILKKTNILNYQYFF